MLFDSFAEMFPRKVFPFNFKCETMEGSLFTSENPDVWRNVLDQYSIVMKRKSDDKKKKELNSLDSWFQNELPKKIASRSPRHITKEDIEKLMKWKLMRGKFRPRLTELIKQNAESEVKKLSENAFKNAANVVQAIKELSKLKAVGPATASAIMCAANPEVYAFMADEAMASIPSFKNDYTLPHYEKFLKHMSEKAKMLKKGSAFEWTPHKVELALWTHATARKLGISLDVSQESDENESGGKKRKIVNDDEDTDDETDKRKRKRK